MKSVYLFDWGDTLMVDIKNSSGKMRDWETVIAIDCAQETLKYLSQNAKLYIATGAAESKESDIRAAFSRVNLDCYIDGYFCCDNIGVNKGDSDFLPRIVKKLDVNPKQCYMVGDSLDKDIYPALAAGIKPIWFNANGRINTGIEPVYSIRCLSQLKQGR
ncbi:HAD family hydrolase [Psychrobium sp. nBUS_13]|uniref:HAD family hydrolase n=1 Tax=Psychrobium sp. nBUS_13 TaxID=3395319 RepID=UPI003EBBB4EF